MMLFAGFRMEVKKFFGTIMLVLKERGYNYDGAQYVMHYDVYDWCNYMMNGYRWPADEELRKFVKYNPRLEILFGH